ncbi:EF-hand domain-containing protein [Actinocorallia longicatena]|uniref:EF-hand domain-containing protein n=1 Tax=Actinocorallia longicatena TaxID=111803 RepID=A0ABP6Q7D7_9ACTN
MALTEQEATEAFHVVDTNNDGMITPQELAHLWERNGDVLGDDELLRIFAKADTDHDGLISLPEFIALLG